MSILKEDRKERTVEVNRAQILDSSGKYLVLILVCGEGLFTGRVSLCSPGYPETHYVD